MPIPGPGPINDEYSKYMTKKYQMSAQIADTLNTVSPINDFSGPFGIGGTGIASVILWKQKPYDPYSSSYWTPYSKTISVLESLSYVWTKVLGLIVEDRSGVRHNVRGVHEDGYKMISKLPEVSLIMFIIA